MGTIIAIVILFIIVGILILNNMKLSSTVSMLEITKENAEERIATHTSMVANAIAMQNKKIDSLKPTSPKKKAAPKKKVAPKKKKKMNPTLKPGGWN